MKLKFKFIDLFIILACIGAGILFVSKLNLADGRGQVLQKDEKAEITMAVPFIESEIIDHLKVGDPVKDVMANNPIGKVTKIEVNKIDPRDFTFEGKVLKFDDKLYKKATVTIEAQGKKTDKGILIGQTNYFTGQTNTFGAGLVKLFNVRISGIKYLGE